MSFGKSIAFSPRTNLDEPMDNVQDFCIPENPEYFPDPGDDYGYVTFSKTKGFTSDDVTEYETCTYTGKEEVNDKMRLTGLTREVEGSAQEWGVTDWCASVLTDAEWVKLIAEQERKTVDLDFDGNKAIAPLIEGYTEQDWQQSHTIAGDLTLNIQAGNVQRVTLSANVTGLIITNAAAGETTPLTLELMPTVSGLTMDWIAPTEVIDSSIGVSVEATDNSFNSSAAFADVLQPGDTIITIGFNETPNNGEFKVESATTSKIVVVDASAGGADLTTEAAGETVDIDRWNLLGNIPGLPDPYMTLVVTLWSHDAARWKITEVGEF